MKLLRRKPPRRVHEAQRDYFGAHTNDRTDHPRGKFFHTDWNAKATKATSNHYHAGTSGKEELISASE